MITPRRKLYEEFLCITSFLSIFPFFWMIIGMTNSSMGIIKGKLSFGRILSTNVTNCLNSVNLSGVLWTSIKNSLIEALLTLLLCSMAGYRFEIYQSQAKSHLIG